MGAMREETNCSWVCMDVSLHVSGEIAVGLKRLACSWSASPVGRWPYSWAGDGLHLKHELGPKKRWNWVEFVGQIGLGPRLNRSNKKI